MFDKNRKKVILAAFFAFVINFGLDRITKIIAKKFLMGNGVFSYLKNIFVLVYAENSGAFLSMGANWNIVIKYIVLVIIPILFCLAGLWWCIFRETDVTRCVLFVTIITGGLGNLLDRLFNNFMVVDFMNFGIGTKFRTGILNIADLSITFGVIIFIIYDLAFAKNKFLEKQKDDKKKSN
ncbi:MAG: signal peptidase II [Treponemataceae bacterium]